MTQRTATEKDMFLQSFARECQTTLKLLKELPPAKLDFKPHEKSRSARELAWIFTLEQGIVEGTLAGHVDFTSPRPQPPASLDQMLAAFEKASASTAARVSAASEEDLNHTVPFPVGPGRMADLRRLDVLWATLMDQVHHRGQLSVYLRLVGAKVPSIYGPSADEPWM